MALSPGVWPLLGLLWLLTALPVHSRGDAFQVEEMPEKDLVETTSPSDDILDINQELILLEEPESSLLMEGDIIRVSPFRMFPFADPRWPRKGGFVQVPYIISYKYDKSSMKMIQEAFRDFEKFTCIKFVPYSSQRDFISIAPLSGCFSSVGRTGGMQVVSLAAACLRKGKAVVLHELMHVLGFWHEHSRADRDKYISIAWDEILTGFETNFMKSWTTNMLVNYDYSSVMHYGRNAFSMRGLPTIIPLSRSCPVIGQSWNLSSSDIARVNKLYRCSQAVAQPAATEQAIEGTMAGFVPSESILPTSKVGVLTAWSPSPVASSTHTVHSTRESLQPYSPVVEEGFHATAVHSRGMVSSGTEAHGWHMMSLETPSKAEHPMVTEGMLHRMQPTEMAMEGNAQKASVSQALQNVVSSADQPSHFQDYTPSGQNATESTRQTAPKSTSLLTSPAPLTVDVAEGTAGRPSKSILYQLLSGTRSMHSEQTEPPTSLAVEGSVTEDDDSVPMLSWSREVTGLPYLVQTTKGLPVLSGSQWELVATEETSQGAEAKGQGSILPATDMVLPPLERNPSPSWVSHSGNLGEVNRTDHHPESMEGTSLAARSEPSELLTGTPESATARSGRTAAMTPVGSTALALEGPPSSPPVGGSESPGHSGSSLVPFWDRTTGRLGNSQPENARPFAGGRLAELANATKEAVQEGVDWATTKDAVLAQRGFASALPEVGFLPQKSHTVTKGLALSHTAGSLDSPKFVFHSEGPAANHPPGEVLSSTGLPVGTATVLQASATPLEASEKTTAANDARADRNTVSKKSRKPSAETPAVGSVPLTKISRWAPVVWHTAIKPARVGSWQLQTETARLEGPAWSTSESRGKAMKFLFQKGTSPVIATGVQVSPAATGTRWGSKRSAGNRTEIPEAASTDVGPSLLRWGESTATSAKKGPGPTSKLTLETTGNISPGVGRTSEMASSVSGAKNYLGGEKTFPSEGSLENGNPVPVESTEGAAASIVGISSVHPQTRGLVEMVSTAFDQALATQGPHGQSKLLGKRTPGGMRSRKQLFPLMEASKQTSKTQTIVRLDEKTRSLAAEVELQQNKRPSLDGHNVHQIGKDF